MTPINAPHQGPRGDVDPSSPMRTHSRTHSMSSDRPSLTGYGGLLSPPTMTSPEPIYIAASAASQIVTNDHDSHSETWFDQHGIEPSGETALVNNGALKLVNSFLDQLLFNFLSVSRSTSLASLRPAVSEVLKPKLAKDAIGLADQELLEYLGGGEDEELLAFHNGLEPSGDWDLELVWKRTRLRCMVYSSLGDMEEEDEDHYTELEQLDGPPGSNNRFSSNPGVVSPAVAIFLTSILEFMGEQALVVAGQAAYDRLRLKHEKEEREGVSKSTEIADRVVVAEMDMERVALDRTLGRLWRGWKKRIRSPTPSMSLPRSFSRESTRSRGHSRMNSNEPSRRFEQVSRELPASDSAGHQDAASVPLPVGEDDVREIEIPGVAYNSDDEDDEPSEDEDDRQPRPKSMMVPLSVKELLTRDFLEAKPPTVFPQVSRKRSHSLPSQLIYSSYSTSKRPKTIETEPEAKVKETDATKAGPDAEESHEEKSANAADDESTAYTDESQDKGETQEKPISEKDTGKLAAVIAGVAAAGAAAVAGITAVAQGGAPQTVLTPGEESDIEGLVEEEPQILTSARVSVHEKVAEHTAITSRPGSIHASSVNSLKVVDVSSPRSPTRSRGGSLTSMEPAVAARPASFTRSGSNPETPIEAQVPQIPRGTSPVQRASTSSPVVRISPATSMRAARNGTTDSISEVDEKDADPSRSTPVTSAGIPERSLLRESKVPASASALRRENEKASTAAHSPSLSQHSVASAHSTTTRPLRETSLVEPKNLSNPSMMAQNSGAKASDAAASTLGPLRELMEGAQDTSDEASSIALSYRAQNGSSSTVSVSGAPRSQPYPDTNRAADPPKVSRNAGGDKPRISPSQTQQEEDNARPGTSSKSNRKLHTSSSSTSSGSHKVRPIRTSEDSVPSPGLDKAKTFEQLIQSDQTIQYTLTPKNMREMEPPESPRAVSLSQPPSMQKSGERPRTSSLADRGVALHSNPPPTHRMIAEATSRPIANSGAKVKLNAQARDARVDRDSTGDFADFIRSTGPPRAYEDSQPRSASAANTHRGQNGSARNISTSSRRTTTPNGVTNGPPTPPKSAVANGAANRTSDVTPRRSQSSATRLQAREAVVPYGDSSSDLIDFIRQGPPTERSGPRVARAFVSPRGAVDSDRMSGAVGARITGDASAEPRHSHASTNEASMRSVQSSVNSQSALLNGQNAKKPSPSKDFGDDDMMPKRKTRRIKDPYAIDLSDEDEEYNAIQAKPVRQEESLVDFLKNVPPPPGADSPALIISPKAVGRKSSAPSLISRLSRNSVSHGKNHSSISAATRANKEDTPQTVFKTFSASVTAASDGGRRSSKSHAHNTQPSNATNYISRLDSERRPARPAQKIYEPRDAVGSRSITRSATTELADFLKNTEPPPSNGPQRLSLAGLEPKEEGRFERMFGRRKKAAAA